MQNQFRILIKFSSVWAIESQQVVRRSVAEVIKCLQRFTLKYIFGKSQLLQIKFRSIALQSEGNHSRQEYR